jgi:uncharacterized protein YaiE (UPF0345 family)
MLKHNTYFENQVQSIAFERHGRRQTVGVVATGEFTFNTDGPERMTIINGELMVKDGGGWARYAAGTSFEIAAKTAFTVKASAPAAYWCEFI